jgi:hypothetical protein
VTQVRSYLLARLSRRLDELGLDVADVATPRADPFFAARREQVLRTCGHKRSHR